MVNIDGFYDGFINQIKRASLDGVLYNPIEDYFHIESDVEDALNWCIEKCDNKVDGISQKWQYDVTSAKYVLNTFDESKNDLRSTSRKVTSNSVPSLLKENNDIEKSKTLNINMTYVSLLSLGILIGYSISFLRK